VCAIVFLFKPTSTLAKKDIHEK